MGQGSQRSEKVGTGCQTTYRVTDPLYKPAPTNHTETRQVSREWGQPLGNEAGISPVSRVMCLLLGSRVEVKQKRHTALGITVEYENLGHLGTPLLPGFDRLLLEDQFTPLGLEGFR